MNCVGDFLDMYPQKEFEEFGEYFNAKKVRSSRPRIFPFGYKERKMAFFQVDLLRKNLLTKENL